MKTKSAAYQKAEAYRDRLNSKATKVEAKDLTSVVYIFTNTFGKICARGYRGRSTKPAMNNYFLSEESRKEAVIKFMERCSKNKNTYIPKPRDLFVGDILMSSWGYDQTNIDYYKVLQTKGKTQVVIAEVGQLKTFDEYDQGSCTPDVNNIVGEPMTKKADGDRVRIASFASASKIHPKIIAGAKIYEASSWTSYH